MSLIYKDQTIADVGGSSEEVYSTEETRIGTWIDGKPLYRIVLQRAGKTTTTMNYGLLSERNIDTLCKVDGYIRRITGVSTSIPNQLFMGKEYPTSEGSSRGLFSMIVNGQRTDTADTRELKAMIYNLTSNFEAEWIVILEYTKTTDEATS